MHHFTRQQLREIDRRSVEEFHIPGIVLMENAARAVADESCNMLAGECCGMVLVLCGGGNNGGDGLATARHLHNRGAEVLVGLAIDPAKYKGDALTNWNIVQAMGIPARAFEKNMLGDGGMLVIDAVFGTGLDQPPRAPFAEIARAVNESRMPVLAVDIPSGLDCDTGQVLGECIRANRTVSFVGRKKGFAIGRAMEMVGEVVVGEIGCPVELVESVLAGSGARKD